MWLYIPSIASPCAQESEDLTWGLNLLCRALASFVTWRGKLSPWKSWSKRYKKVPWIRRLFGRILRPSMVRRGVDAWISSLLDSHANRGLRSAAAKVSPTSSGCGLTSTESFVEWSPVSSSWRMCRASVEEGSDMFLGTWPKVGSMRNGVVSVRNKSAQGTKEKDFSYWPTPTVGDSRGSARRTVLAPSPTRTMHPGTSLVDAARLWDAPQNHSFPQVLKRVRPGALSPSNSGRPILNPLFVEWLMGLPAGLISFELSVTGLSHWQQLMRSELYCSVHKECE